MTQSELGSRSDLEALKRSGRGKVVVLIVLLAVALAAASWSFLRPSGTGNPEEATKVLVVTRDSALGYSSVLTDGGFEAAEATLAAWIRKAEEEVPDLEVSGVAAVMALADRFGYGFVAFEAPQEIDFGDLDIDEDPSFDDSVKFAVLSAGDYAFPHALTVNPKPSEVMRDPGLVLLQALFAQEQLQDLGPDNENPSIEQIKLRDKLSAAIDRVERIPEAERMAQQIVEQIEQQLVSSERAEPKPTLVGEPLQSANSFPLADGTILAVSRGFSLVTRDAVRADLDLEGSETLLVGVPGTVATERSVCTNLAGGTISVHDSARYAASADGSAMLIKTLSEGLVLWVLADGKPGCSFERGGEVPAGSPGVSGIGVPHKSGKVARSGNVGGQGVIEVVRAGTKERTTLGMIDGIELRTPVWLDNKRLVAVGRGVSGEADALYFFDLATPLSVLRLPATVAENAMRLGQVAVLPGDEPGLVMTAGSFPRKLYRVALPSDEAGLFAEPPAWSEVPTIERAELGEPDVVTLDPNAFVVRALTDQGRAHDPVVSPDGKWVAFGISDGELDEPDASDDDEIGLAATGDTGPKLRLLTRNALKDHGPAFTADSKHVVFRTRVEIPRTNWVITAPRLAPVTP